MNNSNIMKKTATFLVLAFLILLSIFLIRTLTTKGNTDCPSDLNGDKRIDSLDLAEFNKHYGRNINGEHFADLNKDSVINTLDLNILLSGYGKECP